MFWNASNIIPKIHICVGISFIGWFNGSSKDFGAEYDQSLMADLMMGSLELPDMKIIGAMLNPFLNVMPVWYMVEAGICTWNQFETGQDLLLYLMTCYYEHIMESVVSALVES